MLEETPLVLSLAEVDLECRLAAGRRDELVVLCHPHPLYGGSMDNNVVLAARDACRQLGYGTLRFNFRGVGSSSGTHGGGEEEADDLQALLDELAGRPEAAGGLHLAGYSFGAWVAVTAVARGVTPCSLLLFSPPVDFISFDGLSLPEIPCLITAGDFDDYCRRTSLDDWLSQAVRGQEPVRVQLPGDHFYFGQEEALKEAIVDFLGVSRGS
jgi:alpha/beta superfamily hydrolase